MADLEIVRPVVARHQLADVVQSCRRSTETFYNPIRVVALMITQPSVATRFKFQLAALNSESYCTVTNITFTTARKWSVASGSDGKVADYVTFEADCTHSCMRGALRAYMAASV
jgi:hypothetical protein